MDNIEHLLIVDDNPEDQVMYKRFIVNICQKPIGIHTVEKGALALDFLKTHPVDCILLDYQLPDMTGLDFLKKIKKQQNQSPIIMLTGAGNEKIAIEALKLGAYDYLNKGELHPEILCKTISNAVEKSTLTKRIKEKEAEINYLAYHDYLTGIPNRAQFELFAKNTFARAQRYRRRFAIFIIDLDQFKFVNDKYGHETGDLLLKEVVKLFQDCLRISDMLARIGGDEFAIITDHIEQAEYTSVIAKKLIESLSLPLMINEHRIKISPSIGIALYPDSGATVSNLLSNADIALYKAKNEGKNTFCYFTSELNIQSYAQVQIENALYSALEQQDFYCCYQPIMNIDTKSLFAIELLLQSENPLLKNITIKHIIEMANKTGLILSLGLWMVEKAFQQLSKWQEIGKNFKLSINLSAQQLEYESWLKTLNSLIRKYQVDPHNLIFELNESEVLFNLGYINKQLCFFTDLGCAVYIDNFGTGYSSLNLIRKLPITGVKMDSSFIQNIKHSAKDAKMVQAIILLVRELGMSLIIEGIETQSQLNFIKPFAGINAQGLYFSKPLKPAEISEWLSQI